MLAVQVEDATKLKYPLYASPKIDGLRALVKDGRFVSRTIKLLPNNDLQDKCYLERLPEGLDGELVLGDPTNPKVFNITQSSLMSFAGSIEGLTYIVFDLWNHADRPYAARHATINQTELPSWCVKLEQRIINTSDELDAFEEYCLGLGYEGVMVRKIDAPYKYGRSTLREGYLLKVKRFADAEATIIGYTQQLENHNPKELDERGYSKRSSHIEGQILKEALGSFLVVKDGVEFGIGSGFTAAEREEFWLNRENLVGKQVRFKYLPHGQKIAPRHPIYLGLRFD